MTWVDFGIIAALAVSFVWSFRHGLIMELVYFVSIVMGLVLAFLFYPLLGGLVSGLFESRDFARTVSFGLVFIFGGGFVAILGVLFHRFVHFINLGWFDRILGGLFGLVKAAVLVSVVLVMTLGLHGEEPPEYLDDSWLSGPFVNRSTHVMKTVPPLFDTFLEDYGKKALHWVRPPSGPPGEEGEEPTVR